MKADIFEKELEFIKYEELRNIAKDLIEQLPDYFFKVPASSTGKYHPRYTQGEGGLVRHTKAAVCIAQELLRLEMYEDLLPIHDHIIMALLLHDGWKHGPITEDGSYNQWTTPDHARVCANWIMSKDWGAFKCHMEYVSSLILTHMGQWNMNNQTGEIFAPKPEVAANKFVHLCDYLASRKFLEFDENEVNYHS